MPHPGPKRTTPNLLRKPWLWAVAYLALLVASHVTQRANRPASPEGRHVTIPAMTDAGRAGAGTIRLAYESWEPDTPEGKALAASRSAVILIHGSPGEGSNFSRPGPLLAQKGFRVFAPDMPGFGGSEDQPSLSTLAHARAVVAMMDALRIERAHLLGWSMGGGVALHVSDLLSRAGTPERAASLTLMGSVGRQANEATGSAFFEHAKYAAGRAIFGYGFELVPHFGLLGTHRFRMNWLRNFDQTDFSLHDPIIASMSRPTLILHGVHDMLIPIRAARDHFERMPASSLTILDANHFLAFMQVEEMVQHLPPFWNAVDRGLPRPRHDVTDLGGPRHGSAAILEPLEPAIVATPWWVLGLGLALLTFLAPAAGVLAAAVMVDGLVLDNVLAVVGIASGFGIEAVRTLARGADPSISREDWTRRFDRDLVSTLALAWRSQFVGSDRLEVLAAARTLGRRTVPILIVRSVASVVWTLAALIPALIALGLTMPGALTGVGVARAGFALALTAVIGAVTPMLLTLRGRQHLRRRWARLSHHEYWLAWIFYAPLVPLMAPFLRRLGGFWRTLMSPTAINPGIGGSGGFIGESKAEIMDGLFAGVKGHPEEALLLPTLLIPPGPIEARMQRLTEGMSALGMAFPLILKPDSGQRGFGVRLVRDAPAAHAYFQSVRTPAIAQPFHPGPGECGVCWVRSVEPRADGLAGTIFSITRKDFPVLEGDGARTLEDLVWAHPRFRNQAPVFLARHASRRSWIPAAGERVPLGVSGNHCQGTLFRDGADLITPELARSIDTLAARFLGRGVTAGLDYGRFDLRYTSDDELRTGRGFAVVELNGALGESTNLYDPSRSPVWAYRILQRQWEALYVLGVWRRARGFPTITMRELIGRILAHFRERSGSELAD